MTILPYDGRADDDHLLQAMLGLIQLIIMQSQETSDMASHVERMGERHEITRKTMRPFTGPQREYFEAGFDKLLARTEVLGTVIQKMEECDGR